MEDYICYILKKYPKIDNIILPNKTFINKYNFLYEFYPILAAVEPYWDESCALALESITYVLKIISGNKEKYDKDLLLLHQIIKNKVKECKSISSNKESTLYQLLTEILIRISILCENIYLHGKQDGEKILYKTSSYNIDHVLDVIEKRGNKGIRFFCEKNPYNFHNSMKNILDYINNSYGQRQFGIGKLKLSYSPIETLDIRKYKCMIYCEALILLSNECDKQIQKELPYNEW
ncbi:hypothetical protein NE634_15515 [Lacrimispora saccharolytica]|nr:hypothetical protein [Lacrimispora saccharolytica]